MPPKYSKKFLSDRYNYLYNAMEEELEKFNICNICTTPAHAFNKHILTHGQSPEGTYPYVTCYGYASGEKGLCCGPFAKAPLCKHWKKKGGCSVKSLRCKVWVCNDSMPHAQHHVNMVIQSPVDGYPKWQIYIGLTQMPIISTNHAKIIDEMRKYKFHRLFRATKTEVINWSYQYFKEKYDIHQRRQIRRAKKEARKKG